jgi:serine protease Do
LIGATLDLSSGAAFEYPTIVSVLLDKRGGESAKQGRSALPAATSKPAAGDRWIYTIEDRYTGIKRDVALVVERTDVERVLFNGGGRIEAHDGSVLPMSLPVVGDLESFEPPQGWGRPLMPLGLTWDLRYLASDGAPRSKVSIRAQVVKNEEVKSGAGTFDTVLVRYTGDIHRSSGAVEMFHTATFNVWIDKSSSRVVRFESEVFGSSTSQPARVSRERIELTGVMRNRSSSAASNPG